mmetsp:Transcript_50506/g.146815  ORF Transcript_50506/g.146815 Transcript_50506/m.146815 type:complete len:537 (-) Transcript_50506:88-1698(-)
MSSANAKRRGPQKKALQQQQLRDQTPERASTSSAGAQGFTPACATPVKLAGASAWQAYTPPEFSIGCPQPRRPIPYSMQTLPGSPSGSLQGVGAGSDEAAGGVSSELQEFLAGAAGMGPGGHLGFMDQTCIKAMAPESRPLSSISTNAGPTPDPEERAVPHPSQLLDGLRAPTPEDDQTSGWHPNRKKEVARAPGRDEGQQKNKVFLGGIPQQMSQADLLQVISSNIATVRKAWLQKKRPSDQTQSPPQNHGGFGFAVFEDEGAVERFLGQEESRFIHLTDGGKIEVKRARTKSEMARDTKAPSRAQQQGAQSQSQQRGQNHQQPQQESQQHRPIRSAAGSSTAQGVPHQVQCPWPITSTPYMSAPVQPVPLHHPQPVMMPFGWPGGQAPHPGACAMVQDFRGQVTMIAMPARDSPPPQGVPATGATQDAAVSAAGAQMCTPAMQQLAAHQQQQVAFAQAARMAMTTGGWPIPPELTSSASPSPVPEAQVQIPIMYAPPSRSETPVNQNYEVMVSMMQAMNPHILRQQIENEVYED